MLAHRYRKYLRVFLSSLMIFLTYRGRVLLVSIGNILYFSIVYFFWKSIFQNIPGNKETVFEETFIYLAGAITLSNLFRTWTDWHMSNNIVKGNIVIDLIRPIDFQYKTYFVSLGSFLCNFLWVGLPAVIVIFLFVDSSYIALENLFYFVVAIIMAFTISFNIDYIVGLTGFFTESIWGISITKETIVLILSGAVVPIAFFPEFLAEFVKWLPFRAIYHDPMTIITSKGLLMIDCMQILLLQATWLLITHLMAVAFYEFAIRRLTINGG